MKRLASRSTWWHTLPHKSTYAVNAAERKGQPWNHVGIDVHKKDSQICLLAEGGELIERRIRTELARFAAVLGDRPRVESGTSGGPVVTREGKLLGIVSTAGGAVEERTRSGTIARVHTAARLRLVRQMVPRAVSRQLDAALPPGRRASGKPWRRSRTP